MCKDSGYILAGRTEKYHRILCDIFLPSGEIIDASWNTVKIPENYHKPDVLVCFLLRVY